jgi:hypothetical protein
VIGSSFSFGLPVFVGVPIAVWCVIKSTPQHSLSVKSPAVTRAKVFCHGGTLCNLFVSGFLPESAACSLRESRSLPAMNAKFFHSDAW